MSTTPDLGLPEIASQQSQPEITHNEALYMIQALVNGVIDKDTLSPPELPTEGDAYLIAGTGADGWAGKDNKIAIYAGGSWRYVPDVDDDGNEITVGTRNKGLRVYVRDENQDYIWDGTAWAAYTVAGTAVIKVLDNASFDGATTYFANLLPSAPDVVSNSVVLIHAGVGVLIQTTTTPAAGSFAIGGAADRDIDFGYAPLANDEVVAIYVAA